MTIEQEISHNLHLSCIGVFYSYSKTYWTCKRKCMTWWHMVKYLDFVRKISARILDSRSLWWEKFRLLVTGVQRGGCTGVFVCCLASYHKKNCFEERNVLRIPTRASFRIEWHISQSISSLQQTISKVMHINVWHCTMEY